MRWNHVKRPFQSPHRSDRTSPLSADATDYYWDALFAISWLARRAGSLRNSNFAFLSLSVKALTGSLWVSVSVQKVWKWKNQIFLNMMNYGNSAILWKKKMLSADNVLWHWSRKLTSHLESVLAGLELSAVYSHRQIWNYIQVASFVYSHALRDLFNRATLTPNHWHELKNWTSIIHDNLFNLGCQIYFLPELGFNETSLNGSSTEILKKYPSK